MSGSEKEERPRSPTTAYLDGLRGVAALVVFAFHTTWAYCGFVEYGYGDGPENRRILQLPFLRLVHAGHAVVAVFFVVGGYVMALKPLRRARAPADVVASPPDAALFARSLLRKAFRLYVPALVATLLALASLRAGLWEYPRRFIANPGLFSYADRHPPRAPTLGAEVTRWANASLGLFNLLGYVNDGFRLPYYNPYDPHLWTLPFEMRASLVVAGVLFAVTRFRAAGAVRLAVVAAAVVLSVARDRWECALFLGGAALAEVDLAVRRQQQQQQQQQQQHGSGSPSRNPVSRGAMKVLESRVLPAALLLPALYLLSTPNLRIRFTPGYGFLRDALVPGCISDPKRFLQGAGALLLVFCLNRSAANARAAGSGDGDGEGLPWWQRLHAPFDHSRFVGEAARRSYALYIVHGPVLHVVGYSVTPTLWEVLGYSGAVSVVREKGKSVEFTGPEDRARWVLGFVLGSAVTWTVAWWLAGVFERYVERGFCKRVSVAVEEWCFGREGEGERDSGEGRVLPR